MPTTDPTTSSPPPPAELSPSPPTGEAFAALPHSPQSAFVLSLYSAIFHLLVHLRQLVAEAGEEAEDSLAHHPFLAEYLAEMSHWMPDDLTWEEGQRWWRDEVALWEAACEEQLPLTRLGLSFDQRCAVMLTGLVEEDSRFGSLFQELQAPLPHRRPTIEVLGSLAPQDQDLGSDPWGFCQPLLSSGLLVTLGDQGPRSEWPLQVPALLWDAMRGSSPATLAPWGQLQSAVEALPLEQLIFDPLVLTRLKRLPRLLLDGQRNLVLRAAPGIDGLEVSAALAGALGRGLLRIDPRRLGESDHALLAPLATLTGCIPVFSFDLGPGETATPPRLAGYDGPRICLLGSEGGLDDDGTLTLELPTPGPDLRRQHWQRALGRRPVEDLPTLAASFCLGGGFIQRIADTAAGHAQLDGRTAVSPEDARRAARELNRQLLDNLATELPTEGSWDRLICTRATHQRLTDLERRCRLRERLEGELGAAFGHGPGRGVRALFTGTSGTGKTLAVKILAAELGMDLYRVDLASVINKYIGETEKNLHRVLSRAEALDVVLLLDEGDALLAGRTEVKSANDRYANLETDFLLQRLESYQGILVVTTNLGENIDAAFQRRMDVVVPFVPPEAGERAAILDLHLPPEHQVAPATLERLAAGCRLSGGQLRNAALSATLLALDEGSAVGDDHLDRAFRGEYRKAGASFPLANSEQATAPNSGDAFAAALEGLG
ncbi:MAG: ATP-binding protein [Acidobacteriota bacterium]